MQQVDVPAGPGDGGLVAGAARRQFDAEDAAVGGEDVLGEEGRDGEAAQRAVGGHFGGFEHAGALGLEGGGKYVFIKGVGKGLGDVRQSFCPIRGKGKLLGFRTQAEDSRLGPVGLYFESRGRLWSRGCHGSWSAAHCALGEEVPAIHRKGVRGLESQCDVLGEDPHDGSRWAKSHAEDSGRSEQVPG